MSGLSPLSRASAIVVLNWKTPSTLLVVVGHSRLLVEIEATSGT